MTTDSTDTTAPKPIQQEIASITRDPNVFYFGNVLQNADGTLITRGVSKGLAIYEELKRDCHASAVLGKRKLAVTSRDWKLVPASDAPIDVQACAMVQAAFEYLHFNRICKRLLEAVLKGFAVGEVMWEVRDGLVLPAEVKARDQRRFVFGVDGSLRLRTRENQIEGELMPERKFIVHRHGGDDDTPYGLGLGSSLFWPVFFKRKDITFWLTFADKFGSPTAVGKYPDGADKKMQTKLLDALRAISQDAGIIIPEGMLIELLESSKTGSTDTYEKLARYMDEQISKAVLGETMSTTASSSGLGSNQADVHNDVRLELAKDDADELSETLNDTLVRWIVEFNMPQAGMPRLERDFSEPEDLLKRAQRDETITGFGFEPTDDYVLKTYGEGWQRKAVVTAEVIGDPGGDDANASLPPAFSEGAPLQRARDLNAQAQASLVDASEAIAAQWKTVMGKRVDDLLSMLDETGDLVLFRERMAELVDKPPEEEAVTTVARATFASHVLGRGVVARVKKALGGR